MAADHYDQVKVLAVRVSDDLEVEVVGYSDPSAAEGTFEWFDLFDTGNGECLNEGDPLYAQPTPDQVRVYLSGR